MFNKMNEEENEFTEEGISVSLTYSQLDVTSTLSMVKSPKAGAVVLFAGTYCKLHSISPRLTLRRYNS